MHITSMISTRLSYYPATMRSAKWHITFTYYKPTKYIESMFTPMVVVHTKFNWSSTSSVFDFPSAIAITLFFPKKNLESFHSFRKSFNFVFLMLSTVNKKICSYFDRDFLISSIVFCFKSRPFLFVCVRETEMNKNISN